MASLGFELVIGAMRVSIIVSQVFESVTGNIFVAVQDMCNQAHEKRAEQITELCVVLEIYTLKGTGKVLGDFSSDKLPVLSGMYVCRESLLIRTSFTFTLKHQCQAFNCKPILCGWLCVGMLVPASVWVEDFFHVFPAT